MIIKFTKLHALGNDYHLIDCISQSFPADMNWPAVSQAMSHRYFGVGSEGIILVKKSDVHDFKMQIFNADGSEAEVHGNSLRCCAKYIYDHKLTDKKMFSLETRAGLIRPEMVEEAGGKAVKIRVDMGEPILEPDRIPVKFTKGKRIVGETFSFSEYDFKVTCVSMGNPHCVIFVEEITDEHVLTLGPLIHAAPIFPRRINVEFVEVVDRETIKMRMWERDYGEIMASGTGACATFVAAVLNKYVGRSGRVILPGGILHVEWSEANNRIYLTGPAVEVFTGEFPWE